jgi:hypothetical protein
MRLSVHLEVRAPGHTGRLSGVWADSAARREGYLCGVLDVHRDMVGSSAP